MRKVLLVVFTFCLLVSCKQNEKRITSLEKQIKDLKQELDNVYKPGFGDMMCTIQMHHSKLWFSGTSKNWKLAEFEIHELEEKFEDLEKYQKAKKETKYIPMIEPVLQTLDNAIKEKNLEQFEENFMLLTNTCNSCHTVTNHEYIIIKTPDFQTNINQVF